MATSNDKKRKKVHFLPPIETSGLKISKPPTKAAGLTAVFYAFRHVNMELGVGQGIRLLSRMNQKDGFDCPGCAWPDPDEKRSILGEYCENGAKALAEEATNKQVDANFFKKYSVEELSGWPDYQLGKSGRITEPMVLRYGSNNYEPISWDSAFALIAENMHELSSPDEALFYTSGRTSNEAAFMFQLFARSFGTNNLPDCSNMCHESSGAGLTETLGIGKGSVTLEDLHIADLIMVMGQNPGTNHPRMLTALKKNKQNGGKIISINPLPEAGMSKFIDPQSPLDVLTGGTRIADYHLPVRINGDVPLLKGMMKLMVEAEDQTPGSVFDTEFIKSHTSGFDELMVELRSADLEECIAQSGISLAQMREVVDLVIQKKNIIICWAMGLTQHKNGVQNIRELVNLLLLKGSIGKPGAGTCPVRGHSNVQGDRTVGIVEKPPKHLILSLKTRFGVEVPTHHGTDTVEAIRAMREGKAKVFIGMGGNFISATPDSEVTAAAVQNCKLTVQISTKLNRAHLITGDVALILPCLARTEKDEQAAGIQFQSVENSMGIVHKTTGKRIPTSPNLLSEPAIVARMGAKVVGEKYAIDWKAMEDNYDVIRDHIQFCIPGFTKYNERVRKPEGFYLPNGARKGEFKTDTAKAKFTVNPLSEINLEDDQYLMMTIRSHDQYNTTIYGLDDRYRGIKNGRRVVLMNPEDIKSKGLKSGDLVDLTSHFKGDTKYAPKWVVVPFSIPRQCTATYFPEANVLVHLDDVADRSNTPASKSVVVSIKKTT